MGCIESSFIVNIDNISYYSNEDFFQRKPRTIYLTKKHGSRLNLVKVTWNESCSLDFKSFETDKFLNDSFEYIPLDYKDLLNCVRENGTYPYFSNLTKCSEEFYSNIYVDLESRNSYRFDQMSMINEKLQILLSNPFYVDYALNRLNIDSTEKL